MKNETLNRVRFEAEPLTWDDVSKTLVVVAGTMLISFLGLSAIAGMGVESFEVRTIASTNERLRNSLEDRYWKDYTIKEKSILLKEVASRIKNKEDLDEFKGKLKII